MRLPLRLTATLMLVFSILAGGWGCALAGGKPPNTPHAADGGYADCRSCHEEGSQGAPKTDHAKKPDCISCHRVTLPGGR